MSRHGEPGPVSGAFDSEGHPDDATLQLAADGQLEPAAQLRVDTHAAACPRCAAELAAYGELMTQLNAVPVAEAPASVAEAVLAAYQRGAAPVASLWSDRKLLIAVALTNALLVVAILATIGVRGPVDLLSEWAITGKDLLMTLLAVLPAAEAIWTAMAHGGILLVAALALALMGTVAALRHTLRLAEDTP